MSKIPDRFKHATFDNYVIEYSDQAVMVKGAKAWCRRYLQDDCPDNLLLLGEKGGGKSHVMQAIKKLITGHQLSLGVRKLPEYLNASQIGDQISEAISDRKAGSVVKKKYSECSLLLIDEICREDIKQSARETISQIVDNRYSNLRPTVLASNHTLEEIGSSIDERVIDRLIDGEFTTVLAFTWPSYRAMGKRTIAEEYNVHERIQR